jgi:hypothetical protein
MARLAFREATGPVPTQTRELRWLPVLYQNYSNQHLADFRFARRVVRLHRLGPRALFELLAEIGARHLIRVQVEHIVREYADRLDRDTLRSLGGDRMPPVPVHRILPNDDKHGELR